VPAFDLLNLLEQSEPFMWHSIGTNIGFWCS